MSATTPRTSARKPATRRPDNKPFDFDLDGVKAEVDTSPWVMNWQGRPWTFKHFQELDSWQQMAAAGLGNNEAAAKVFELALGEAEWKKFTEIPLPLYKLQAMFEAYSKHCGIGDAGESSDSGS